MMNQKTETVFISKRLTEILFRCFDRLLKILLPYRSEITFYPLRYPRHLLVARSVMDHICHFLHQERMLPHNLKMSIIEAVA